MSKGHTYIITPPCAGAQARLNKASDKGLTLKVSNGGRITACACWEAQTGTGQAQSKERKTTNSPH